MQRPAQKEGCAVLSGAPSLQRAGGRGSAGRRKVLSIKTKGHLEKPSVISLGSILGTEKPDGKCRWRPRGAGLYFQDAEVQPYSVGARQLLEVSGQGNDNIRMEI